MKKLRYFLLLTFAFFFTVAQAQPTLVKKNGSTHFEIDGKPFVTEADNPIGVCYEMILKLHKLNLL